MSKKEEDNDRYITIISKIVFWNTKNMSLFNSCFYKLFFKIIFENQSIRF